MQGLKVLPTIVDIVRVNEIVDGCMDGQKTGAYVAPCQQVDKNEYAR